MLLIAKKNAIVIRVPSRDYQGQDTKLTTVTEKVAGWPPALRDKSEGMSERAMPASIPLSDGGVTS